MQKIKIVLTSFIAILMCLGVFVPKGHAASRGYIDYLPVNKSQLNPYEKAVLKKYPGCTTVALADSKYAMESPWKLWSSANKYHNDNADAYRHALWNALLAHHCGKTFAKKFTDAHEKGSINSALEKKMDYNNNAVGRSIGIAKAYRYPNKMAEVEAISKDVYKAVKKGKMKRYVGKDIGTKKYLVRTNSKGSLK